MLWLALSVVLGVAEPSAQAREDARIAFESGAEHFGADEFDAALTDFKQAYRLAPHDKVRFNIGQCLMRLGRYREAFVELDAAARGAQLSAGERDKARLAADSAAAQLGTIRFTGAAGEIAGVDDVLECTVPCTLDVDPGEHDVRPGMSAPRRTVTVRTAEITAVSVLPPPRVAPPAGPAAGSGPKPPEAPPQRKARPSALTWVGLGLAVAGGGGIIGFGLRANALHEEFLADPTPSGRRRGVAMRNAANASIGVAALGGILIIADLIRLGVLRRRALVE